MGNNTSPSRRAGILTREVCKTASTRSRGRTLTCLREAPSRCSSFAKPDHIPEQRMKNDLEDISRRTFILAAAAAGGGEIVSGAGLDLMGAPPSAATIDHRSSQMESPIELVRRFCAAWGNNKATADLAAFFTDDAVYHNIPFAPVIGRKAIGKNIGSFLRPGKAAAPGGVPVESIDFRIINIAANGPIGMTGRGAA